MADQNIGFDRKKYEDARIVGKQFAWIALPCLFGLMFYAVALRKDFFAIVGTGIIVAIAALILGVLVGFLFGVPKSGQQAPNKDDDNHGGGPPRSTRPPDPPGQSGLRRNTNIEEISDWLTKIIVGLGIYELKEVPGKLQQLSAFLSPAFGGGPGSGPLAVVLALAFASTGFLLGYLITVLFVAQALERNAPGLVNEYQIGQDAKAAQVIQTIMQGTGVGGVAPALKQQLLDLAARYERERASRSPGPERTRVMSDITGEMRKLALAGWAMLEELKKADSPGCRLATIAFLQIKPSAPEIEWLADRVVNEVPFLKYQAAVALRNAVRTIGATEKDRLKKALAVAKKALVASSDEYAVIQQAEAELG